MESFHLAAQWHKTFIPEWAQNSEIIQSQTFIIIYSLVRDIKGLCTQPEASTGKACVRTTSTKSVLNFKSALCILCILCCVCVWHSSSALCSPSHSMPLWTLPCSVGQIRRNHTCWRSVCSSICCSSPQLWMAKHHESTESISRSGSSNGTYSLSWLPLGHVELIESEDQLWEPTVGDPAIPMADQQMERTGIHVCHLRSLRWRLAKDPGHPCFKFP